MSLPRFAVGILASAALAGACLIDLPSGSELGPTVGPALSSSQVTVPTARARSAPAHPLRESSEEGPLDDFDRLCRYTRAEFLRIVTPRIVRDYQEMLGREVIAGTSRGDFLLGTSGPDLILGFGGADAIVAQGGDDLVCGGPGPDTIFEGNGVDVIRGGPGSDYLG